MNQGRLNWRKRNAGWSLAVACVLTTALTFGAIAPAEAIVVGTYPSTPKAFKVYGKSVQLGASLVTNYVDYRFNDKLLPQSSDTVKIAQKMPQDAVIVGAYLYWGASEPSSGYDNTAVVTLADGAQQTLAADNCETRTDPQPNGTGTHYYCRRDITTLLQAHPGIDHWNGSYTVGGIDAKVASLHIATPSSPCGQKPGDAAIAETVCCEQGDIGCQARYASWTMVFVYDTKFSEQTQRDVFLYDGYVLLDEQQSSLGQIKFTINDFLVSDPPDAQLTYYAMEGDKQLGNPEQDLLSHGPDSPPCDSCYDFVKFNNTELTGGAGNNEPHNIMNSSVEPGLDLDTFDVSNLVKPNDTSANLIVSSGDGSLATNASGSPDNAAGNGEFFVYGWTLLQVNRKAPNFKSTVNKFYANYSEASPGDTLTYTDDLLNTGPLDADNTILKFAVFPPAGTDYVPGSTTVDGVVVSDIGGQSALANGLNLGTLTSSAGGKSNRTVTFKVKVKAVPGVTEIDSSGVVSYTYVNAKYSDTIQTQTSVVKLVPPQLAPPSLAVTPQKQSPAGVVTFTLTLQSLSATALSIDTAGFDLPPELVFVSATGPGTNKSTATGGINSSGQVRFDAVPIASGQQAIFTITAKLKTLTQLQALGINPIPGHIVSAQGSVVLATKTYKTDDPNQLGVENPTVLTLQVPGDLSKSSKTVTDLSPETPFLPGDQVKFTIAIQNTGAGDVTVNVSDQIPQGLAYVSSQSPELTLTGNLLTALVTVPAGQTKNLIFTAQIKADTAPGATFQNLATLAPTDGTTPTTVQTPVTTVQGGPDLSTSVLTVQDVNGGDLEPGDTLTYTLTLNNSGKLATGALQIVLPVDKNLDTVTGIDGGGALDAGTGNILWSSVGVPAGGQVVLHFTVKVKAATTNGTAIAEIATVTGAQLPQPQKISATVKVQANPNIAVFTDVVTSSGGTFNPGDTVTYTLVLQNTGKGVVNNAVLTTTLDPALGTLIAGQSGAVAGQTVTWNLGTLANGDAVKTLTVTAKLATPLAQGKIISNQATLTGDGLLAPALSDDPAKPGKTDATVFALTSAPNLTTSDKSYVDSNGGSVQGGDKLTFTIKLRNTGNSPASNVIVTDLLAPQLTQVVVTGGTFNAATSTVTWNAVPSLLPGDKPPELTFTAVVDKATPSGTTISNTGKIAFTETPLTASTNTVSFTVVNLPDFGASTKTVSAAQIQAGAPVSYSITIVNSGNQAGTGVVVTDVLPKELTAIQPGQGGIFNAGSNTVTWNLGNVAAGASVPLTVSATVKKPLDNALHVCNQAQIKANENPAASFTSPPNTPLTPAGTPTCFDTQSAVQIAFQKNVFATVGGQQLNQATVKPKTGLTYSVKVKNTGTMLATGVAIVDPLPAGLENVAVLDGGAFDATKNQVTWPTIATLGINPTDEVTLRFQATVKTGLDDGTAIQNQALETATGQPVAQKSDDPTTPAVNDATTVSVQSKVDFSKAKLSVVDVNGGDARPGDALTYTLTLKNDGDGAAKNTTVTLPLDARLGDVTASNGGVITGAGTPGATITWALATLLPGDGATLTIQGKIKTPQLNGTVIVEQAQITATGLQVPVLSDADLTTAVREPTVLTVVAKPDLSPSHWTVVDVNGGLLEPGDQVTLGLVLQNKGDAIAQLLNIQAQLPIANLTDVIVFDGGKLTGGNVAWTVPMLSITPAGDVTLHINATIAANTPDGAVLNVVAQIPNVTPNPTATLKVVAQPNLSQSALTADDESGWVQKIGQAAPGHVVRLDVKLKNSGKAAAQNVTVTLPLSAKWANLAAQTGGTVSGNSVKWTVASVPPGATVTLSAKGTIAAADQDGDSLPLQAQAVATNLAAPQTIAGLPVLVVNRPILQVQKSYTDLTGGHLFPGDKARFTLTVQNVGNASAQALQISDDLPPQLVSAVAQTGGTVTGGTVNWLVPTLAPTQTTTVTFEATIGPNLPTGTIIVNQAKAKAQNAQQALSNALNIPVKYPTLGVETKLTPEAPATTPAQPGDTVTLQVIITVPTAENASNVTVSVPVDATVFDVAATKGATWDDAQKLLTWNLKGNAALANIPGGASVALAATLRVKATAANGAVAQGKASAREGETGISYDAKPATLAIVAIPKLKVQKTVEDLNGGKVAPLDVLRYTIAVAVTGPAAAEEVLVEDVLDPRLEVVAVGQGGKQTTIAGVTKVSWTPAGTVALAAVVPGATATLTFDARVRADVPDGASVPNQAQVKANALTASVPSDDPNTPTLGDPTIVLVRTQSALEASSKTAKDDNGGALLPGDTVTWRVTVVATSPAPLTNVKLLDGVPAGMTYEPGSTTLNGGAVADVNGNTPLAVGLAIGTLVPGQASAAVVTFRTRLKADAQDGGQVSNTATAIADNVPPTPIGPATLAIGKGASLRQTQKTAQLLDATNNGQADVGEAIVYTLTVRNTGAGAAELATIDDPLPNTTHYVGSSLTLDGKPLSDVADGDAGRVDATKVHVDLGTIDAGSQRLVTFQVKIVGGVLVSNQAIANAKGLAPEPSDADNDDSNGNQPTLTQIGPAAPLVTVQKSVQDENGGAVQAGDWLRYTLTVVNQGNAKADSLVLQDTLPKGLDALKDSDVLLPPGAQLQNDGATLKVSGLAVQAGESAVVSVRARVAGNVAEAATICNIAKVDILLSAGTQHAESKPACVTAGAAVGEGTISGTIFEDVATDDGVFQAETDLRFPHFQVAVLPPAGVDGAVLTAIADDQGQYHVLHVPNGPRRVRVLSPGGAVFLERTIESPGQSSGKLDLALKPTGRVYDAHAGTLTPGLRLWLRYDDADPVMPNGLLPDDALPQGQQGQTTDASGAYIFSPPTGRAYRIDLVTVSAGWAFPVAGHAPEAGIALLDKQGLVVADALPHIAGNTLPRYLTRFSRQGLANAPPPPPPPGRGSSPQADNGPPPPRHNHLPVEQLTSAISVGVRLSKAQVQVGDLVYAIVTVQNHSSAGFAADALTGRGGVELRDLLPTGLNLVPGAADLTLVGADTMPIKIPLAKLDAPLMVVHRISPTTGKAVGLDLPPGGSLTLRAQMVVTPTAKPGQQLEFAAQLFDVAGQQLSGRSTAQLLVQADPLFDKGMVLVKAYCDGNQNGEQDENEDGLPGARVYADIGQFATTDAYGRAHLMDIPPGNHLFKLDPDTLPPGSTVIGDEQKVLYLTRGISLPLTFPIQCRFESVGPTRVEVTATTDGGPDEAPQPGPGVVPVAVDAAALTIAVDSKLTTQRFLRARLLGADKKPQGDPRLPSDPTSTALEPGAPVVLQVEHSGGFVRHALEIRELDDGGRLGALVMEQVDPKDPPKLVELRARPGFGGIADLTRGRRYALRLRAETEWGSRAWSAPIAFEVRDHVKDPRHDAFTLPARPPRLLINGNPFALDDLGRGALLVDRPVDGKVLISLRQADGAGRDEFVTVAAQGSMAASTAAAATHTDPAIFGASLLDSLQSQAVVPPAHLTPPPPVPPQGVVVEPAPVTTAVLSSRAAHAAGLPAAELQVMLPPGPLELAQPELGVRGKTLPSNRVEVQGQQAIVDEEGHFYALVRLPIGPSTLTVAAIDKAGNRAIVERAVTVKDRALFLLAIADGSVSHVGAHLQEVDQPGSLAIGNAQLAGRVALYAKGRVSGEFLGLKDLSFTAHVDTAKDPNLQDFATNLIDPTRFYPVYGDASVATQDVKARGQLYILVEADKTKFLIGNFAARLQGIELLRYDRTLYGAWLEFTRAYGKFETTVKVLAAQQDRLVARHTDVMRGTGGSLYYLSVRDVVEGSERIDLVIRDRISGMELGRISQARNTDYVIDSMQGRITFKSPISGAVDASLLIGQSGLAGQNLTWNGNPLFIETTYEARGVQSTDSAAFGGQIREKIAGGKVELGGSYVQEGRADAPTYRVAGGDVTVKLGDRSKITGEYAFSQSRDTLLSVSDDGGLTFGQQTQATTTNSAGQPIQGQAVKVMVDVDLRDFLGASTDTSPTDLPPDATPGNDRGRVRAWYQWMQAGFQSGGSIAQQGMQKAGVDTLFQLSKRNALQVRYDGLFMDGGVANPYAAPGVGTQFGNVGGLVGTGSVLPPGSLNNPTANPNSSFLSLSQQIISVQDAHKLDAKWTLLGANTVTYGMDALGIGRAGDTIAAGAAYRPTDRLILRADQQGIIGGDPAQFRGASDHLSTGLGVEYKIAKDLAIVVSERLGWGGENATSAGLRTMLDKSSSLYVQQRLEDTNATGRMVSSSVVGAESRFGDDQKSRAYGEYQIDALNAGRMNRAVMGLGKKFEVAKGLNLDAGYERQQTFAAGGGNTSRDALSLGGEWLRPDKWKLSSRQEVRLDQGDANFGGVRKLQILTLNNGQVGIGKEWTLFGRANYTRTQNQTTDSLEAEALEATLGAAFRPIKHNWLNLIAKVSHLIDMRPSSDGAAANERSVKDILSIEPVMQLPYRLEFSQKAALRRVTEALPDLTPENSSTLLLVSRLGWHVTDRIDLASEYRFLETVLTGDLQHGALLEAAWRFAKALRVGGGYNFTHFMETNAGDIRTSNQGGFFMRLTGLY
jgi:uncharacterized repeat protein (TIGR01451 family)/fimbrial isopeptide formation D2 family protein